jgi:hypothetical protein
MAYKILDLQETSYFLVPWSCTCGASGKVRRDLVESSLEAWDRIAADHQSQSPGCHNRRATAFVSVGGELPQ